MHMYTCTHARSHPREEQEQEGEKERSRVLAAWTGRDFRVKALELLLVWRRN